MLALAIAGFAPLYWTQAVGPELTRAFGLTTAQSASLLTATSLGLVLAAPAAGLALQRFGARRTIGAGLAGLAAVSLAMALARDYPSLLLTRFVQGALTPLVLSTLLCLIPGGPRSRAALAMSATYVTGTILGGVGGRLLPALLMTRFGWQGAGLALALLEAVGTGLALMTVPGCVAGGGVRSRSAALCRTRASSALLTVYGGGLALLFSQTAVFTYIAYRLGAAPFGWSTASLGWLYLVFLPGVVIVRTVRPLALATGFAPLLTAAVALSWLGLLATLASVAVLVVAGLTLFSTSVFFAQALLAHRLSTVASPAQRELATGRYLSCYYLGGCVGAVAPAAAWRAHGWLGCLAVVLAAQAVVALGVMLGRGRGRTRHAAPARNRESCQ